MIDITTLELTRQEGSLGNTEEGSGTGEAVAGGIFSLFTTLIGGTQKKNQDARALEQKKIDLQIEQSREAQARTLASQRKETTPTEKDYTMMYWAVGGVLTTGVVIGGIYYFTK